MDKKIVIYRTHIEINDYDLGDCPPIEKTFSVFDIITHKRVPKGMLYDDEKRILMLPRGIDIGYLERMLQIQNPIVDTDIDPVGDIGQVMLKYKPRDDVQKEAIKFMLSIGQYRRNETSTMMSINLNTGKGKTYCAIAVMAFLRMRSIVITDSVGWLNQWRKFIVEYTDIKDNEIYLISGAPSLNMLYNRDISQYKVLLSTHSTLKSIGDKLGWERISDFFRYCQIGVKFFDEAHLNFDNMFQIDCYTNSFMSYYLTATPARSDQGENTIFQFYFKNVPSIDLFDEDNDPHTKYAAIRFNSHPTATDISDCKGRYGLNRIAYIDYLIHTENFEKVLIILVNMAIKKPGKHLFYVGTNEAILYVRKLIYKHFPSLIEDVGIYTSIVPPEKKKEELEKKIILSTTKSAGAAMDIKGLVETVNLAEPFKSRVLAQQTLGRTRDEGTMYKDVVDTSFYYTKKFYEHKKPIFDRYATECVEVNLNDGELDRRVSAIKEERSHLIHPIEYCGDEMS